MIGIFSFNKDTSQYEIAVGGKVLARASVKSNLEWRIRNKSTPGLAEITSIVYSTETITKAKVEPEQIDTIVEFSINERFGIMDSYVGLVATGIAPSAIITGPGGLGKSHTVLHALQNLKFKEADGSLEEKSGLRNKSEDDEDLTIEELLAIREQAVQREARKTSYVLIKGYSTPKGLFKLLYENRTNLIVFDDCDEVLKDQTSVDLLKSALDSYEKRVVNWNTSSTADRGSLPQSFLFTGSVIFITNTPKHKIPQPIITRALIADVSMSRTEILDRMTFISEQEEFLPAIEKEFKTEAMQFLNEQRNNLQIKELNLRSLINVIKIRKGVPNNWKRVALYNLINSSIEK